MKADSKTGNKQRKTYWELSKEKFNVNNHPRLLSV